MPPLSLSVSSDLLNILLQYAHKLKIDEKEIISACGINLYEYQGDDARIPMHKFHKIWSFILERSKDRNFGLHHGEYCYRLLSRHLIFAMSDRNLQIKLKEENTSFRQRKKRDRHWLS